MTVRNPDAIRPWQHVLNPLHGYPTLAKRLWDAPELAGPRNSGSDDAEARPVGWIARRLEDLWGPGLVWGGAPRRRRPPRGELPQARLLQGARATGLRPAWDLEAGLEALVEWFRAFAGGEAMRDVSLRQIEAFDQASTARSTP